MTNPLDLPYGGIPDGGGYGSNTEYELAAQRIAEEVHCILGSLGKVKRGHENKDSWWAKNYPGISGESGHITEELALIRRDMKEYSKGLYPRQVYERWKEGNKYATATMDGAQDRGLALQDRAVEMKLQLPETDDIVYVIARLCYDVLIALAGAMNRSVGDIRDGLMINAFKDPVLMAAVDRLEFDIKNVLDITEEEFVKYIKDRFGWG